MALFTMTCPSCQSQNFKRHTVYETKHNGRKDIYRCIDCNRFFSSSANTFLAGIRKPASLIATVLKARSEGLGLNATCRTFDLAKNTLLNWERRFSAMKNTLLLYSLLHSYLQLVIEGDEVYTRVNKNVPPEESLGWTVVLMDRASRFLWELGCGGKDRKLFRKALGLVGKLVDKTRDISLITDGERRYGNILFEICHELIRNGKRGRPRKTLRKGVKVRLKNKGSQAQKRGRKRPKYQAPVPEHPDTVQDIKRGDIHANHCEAFNSSLRRRNSAFRRKTNTYAKSEKGLQRTLDIYWIAHNFLRSHFTTKQVPAVALGIVEKGLSWQEILTIRMAIPA
jgi:transposase-like protein/IS1 family transposase